METVEDTKKEKRKNSNTPPENRSDSDYKLKKVKQNFELNIEEEEEGKTRTPSGTICEFNPRDIRTFFSPGSATKNLKECKIQSSQEIVQPRKCTKALRTPSTGTQGRSARSVSRGKVNKAGKRSKRSSATTVHDQSDEDSDELFSTPLDHSFDSSTDNILNTSLPSPSKELLRVIATQIVSYEDFKESLSMDKEDQSRHEMEGSPAETDIKKVQEEGDEKLDMAMETNSIQQDSEIQMPKTMDLQMVWQMFKDLKNDFQQMQDGVEQRVDKISQDCVQKVSQAFDQQCGEKMRQIEGELNHYKHKSEVLTNVCQSLHVEVTDLTQRIENLEMSASKKMLMLAGLDFDSELKKYEVLEQLEKFIKDNLKIDTNVDDYFYLGNNSPRTMVLEMQSIFEKKMVMRYKNMLKDYRTNDGKKVFINDYVPLSIQEKRKREQQILRDISELPNADDIAVSYTAGKLTIQGEQYRKKIVPPTPKDLIELSVSDLNKIMKIKVIDGQPVSKENCVFQGFASQGQNLSRDT